MSERETSSVSWINVIPLNRRERLARWWQEDIRQGSTYTSDRQRKAEFSTAIPVGDIESIACEGLKQALFEQKRSIEESARSITFPRATPDGTEYFGSIGIPSSPIGTRITRGGIEQIADEDY